MGDVLSSSTNDRSQFDVLSVDLPVLIARVLLDCADGKPCNESSFGLECSAIKPAGESAAWTALRGHR